MSGHRLALGMGIRTPPMDLLLQASKLQADNVCFAVIGHVTQRRRNYVKLLHDFPSFPVCSRHFGAAAASSDVNSRKPERGIRKEAPVSDSCQVSLDKTSGEKADTSSILPQTAQEFHQRHRSSSVISEEKFAGQSSSFRRD